MSTQPIVLEQESVVTATMSQFGVPVAVCSLHYMPVKEGRDYRTRVNGPYQTNYQIPAVKTKDDHPAILVVLDAQQRKYRGFEETPRYSPDNIPAMDIAKDLVNVATGGSPGGPDDIRPAVWISSAPKFPRDWRLWGKPEFAQQYPEFWAEVQAYQIRQWKHCEKKIANGDTWHSKGLPLEINEDHRLAAAYIGANSQEHPWMNLTAMGAKDACPFCGAPTSTRAPKCQNCHEIINPALYEQVQERLTAPKKQ
jgi:hypothetical protein